MIERKQKKDPRGNVKLPPGLHRELAMESASTGYAIWELIEDAWVIRKAEHDKAQQDESTSSYRPQEGGLPKDEASVTFLSNLSRVLQKINRRNWVWIEKLAGILASGNKEAFDAVTQNIKVFEKFVELANNGPHSGSAQPETAGKEGISVGRHATEHRPAKGSVSKRNPETRKTGTDGG